jgi:acetyl-CoA acyltransferase
VAQQGREVVIVEAVRTPIGRGHREKGYYRDIHPSDLLGRTYIGLVERSGIDAAEVDTVIAGCVQQFGEQSLNIARNAWLQEGLPIETAATTVDLQCGSAQQAVNLGASLIASGVHDVVIGSGVEHMGHNSFAAVDAINAEHGGPLTPRFFEQHAVINQGIGAELIADAWEIPRSELEQLAVRCVEGAPRAAP